MKISKCIVPTCPAKPIQRYQVTQWITDRPSRNLFHVDDLRQRAGVKDAII